MIASAAADAGVGRASDDLGEAAAVGFVKHDRQKRRGIDNHFGNPSSSYSQLVSETYRLTHTGAELPLQSP